MIFSVQGCTIKRVKSWFWFIFATALSLENISAAFALGGRSVASNQVLLISPLWPASTNDKRTVHHVTGRHQQTGQKRKQIVTCGRDTQKSNKVKERALEEQQDQNESESRTRPQSQFKLKCCASTEKVLNPFCGILRFKMTVKTTCFFHSCSTAG